MPKIKQEDVDALFTSSQLQARAVGVARLIALLLEDAKGGKLIRV